MGLIFRLVWVAVTAWLGRRTDFFAESRRRFRVWPTDLDINIHMTNARYLSIMDLGRVDGMIRSGRILDFYRKGWMPVMGATIIRFRRQLRPFQSYELVSRVIGWDEKWVYLEQRFEVDGQTYAVAVGQATFVGKEGRVSPADILAAFGEERVSPPLPDYALALRETQLPFNSAQV